MGYNYPVGDIYVSADWYNHAYGRTPPSSEPGTDYACAYGTPVAAPDNATVTDVQTSPANATGRYIALQLDDGRAARALHLSAVYVQKGYRVQRGAIIGASGASGYGSDYYYGPHEHQTLWPGSIWAAPTIDFELYVGGGSPAPTPTPPSGNYMDEEDMFIANVKKTSGGTKAFLCVVNPRAAADKSQKPYIGMTLANTPAGVPIYDGTVDWAYNYLVKYVENMNQS